MAQHPIRFARTLPLAVVVLLGVVAVALGISVLVALLHAVGIAGVVLISGVLGSFAVVFLTVLRRRPISVD